MRIRSRCFDLGPVQPACHSHRLEEPLGDPLVVRRLAGPASPPLQAGQRFLDLAEQQRVLAEQGPVIRPACA